MQKVIDTGVFIPVGSGGWIYSTNTPHTPGTFEHVLDVVQRAEDLGFGFALAPAIWRGHKGPAEHWMTSLESLTTSAALLQATSKINIWSTAHMTVFPPAVIAKMITTLDQIGPGRVGLNLVTGSSLLDLDHVGLWDSELSHGDRYALGDEWIDVVTRLWSEPHVTHKGKYFELKNAVMGPKPQQKPFLINAGASPRGLQFAVENCNAAFVDLSENPAAIATAKAAKEIAQKFDKPDFKTFGLVQVIGADTEEEALSLVAHFEAGIDLECLEDIAAGYSSNPNNKETSSGSKLVDNSGPMQAIAPGAFVGSYESLAERLALAVIEADVDGIMLIVPDYVTDLEAVAKKLLPRMAEYGVTCRIAAPETVKQ